MIVELNNIGRIYSNNQADISRVVLTDISLMIRKGDSLSIIGPSGSGKSTLLNIIGTLDKPTSGIVKFEGVELSNLNDKQLAEIRNKKIGFIFQSHHLLPQLTLLENVLLPTLALNKKPDREMRDRALKLIEEVDLTGKINQFPGQLSGGECQRTAVVRALINEPEIILADEPTGSLDEEAADNIGELLSKINKEKNVALIVVTHSEKLATKIGNKYIISNGKIEKS